MAVQTIEQLKTWFMTGLKPLQQQFWDWIDSFRHVSVPIGISDLSADLQTVINGISSGAVKVMLTNAGVASVAMPAGTLLQCILFIDASNPAIGVGKTPGGEEVYPAIDLDDGWGLQAGFAFFKNSTTIYFNNATGNTMAKILYV